MLCAHLEKDRRVAFAALGPLHRFDIDDIGDKIGFNHPVAVETPLPPK